MSQIQMKSGQYVDLLSPCLDSVSILDIAHSLSNLCRFTGHTRYFYSVAQHCCIVHDNMGAESESDRWDALMHDAAEAFTGDIATPLKQLLPEFKTIERGIEKAIFRKWDVCRSDDVKYVDLQAMATERRDLMEEQSQEWEMLKGIEPFEDRIVPWSPAVAKSEFMERAQACYPLFGRSDMRF